MKRKHLDKSGKLPAWLVDANYLLYPVNLEQVLTVYTPNATSQRRFDYYEMDHINLMVSILDHLGVPGTIMTEAPQDL